MHTCKCLPDRAWEETGWQHVYGLMKGEWCRSAATETGSLPGTFKMPRLDNNDWTRWSRLNFSTCGLSSQRLCFFKRKLAHSLFSFDYLYYQLLLVAIFLEQTCVPTMQETLCCSVLKPVSVCPGTLRYSFNPNYSTWDSQVLPDCFTSLRGPVPSLLRDKILYW